MENDPTCQERESPIAVRAAALTSSAFVRVVHTGSHEQTTVMTVPPDGETGEAVRAGIDQLFLVVEGTAEARVADLALGLWPGDVVFVEAGTRHNIVNRAVVPLRLVTVSAPPAHAPDSVYLTRADAEAATSEYSRRERFSKDTS